jgi:nicotinate phosphoribosyltransferase
MAMMRSFHNPSPLLIDLYELTMAQGFLKSGIGQQRAIFHHFFRRLPIDCNFAIAAGLSPFLQWLQNLSFSSEQLEGLAHLQQADGRPLFEDSFLRQLGKWKLDIDLYAMSEGTMVFAHQPLIRVEGPLWQAQILETALLNIVNFSTLVASLTVSIREAAGDTPVWEFGARRAQGPNGALLASRSAWIAGVDGTSLIEAALKEQIPMSGTMAHSWVMAFDSEQQAFDAYADVFPAQSSLLIDTFDLEQGALHACATAADLQKKGKSLQAVRIDSGDLEKGCRLVRRILDDKGLSQVKIIASGDLTAEKIRHLKAKKTPIDVFGVGTEITCAAPDPHLTGVYKLAALQLESGLWKPCAKLSEDPAKRSEPGRRSVIRCRSQNGRWCRDDTIDLLHPDQPPEQHHLFPRPAKTQDSDQCEDLLKQVMKEGSLISALDTATQARERATEQMELWKRAQSGGP